MKIIALANQKGGVAKTTTATALAEALKKLGQQVLLIDTDPQCNASKTYQANIEGETTLYDVLIDGAPITDAIQHTPIGDIVPCDPLLSGADAQIVKIGKEHLLRKALASVAGYDYIVIDTTPALGILLINALTAANQVIVPLTADTYSVDGLAALMDTIGQIREYTNPRLGVPELLLTRWSARTKLSRRCAEELPHVAEQWNASVLPVKIRECVAVREAQDHRAGLLQYAPRSTTGMDYLELARQIHSKYEDRKN